jgi:hypothetical protein
MAGWNPAGQRSHYQGLIQKSQDVLIRVAFVQPNGSDEAVAGHGDPAERHRGIAGIEGHQDHPPSIPVRRVQGCAFADEQAIERLPVTGQGTAENGVKPGQERQLGSRHS